MERLDSTAPYMNARVAGMRSRLLSHAQLDSLIDLDDAPLLVDALVASPYEQEMAEALTRFHGADAIEEALSRNLVNTLQKVLTLAGDDMRPLVEVFLQRWDLAAVKSLLRLRHHEIGGEEALQELQPGPSLTVPLLRSMAERGTMAELVSALAAWNSGLCSGLLQALPEYETDGSVRVLEEALDRAYFVENVATLLEKEDEDSKILCTALRMEIDRINVRILFQLKDADATPDALAGRMLPKGTLTARILQTVASARDAAAAMEVLGKTIYKPLSEMFFMFVQSARFSPMERMFEQIMIRHLRREARVKVMSIAVLMHYVWLKHNEIINIRLMARGETNHLPRGRVREEIMYA